MLERNLSATKRASLISNSYFSMKKSGSMASMTRIKATNRLYADFDTYFLTGEIISWLLLMAIFLSESMYSCSKMNILATENISL